MTRPEPAYDRLFADAVDYTLREWSDGRHVAEGELRERWPELGDACRQALDLAREVAVVTPPYRPDVPGYQLLEEAGRGGMGIVFRAIQDDVQRQVALKLLPQASDSRARQRFLSEAKAMGRIRHPNVVTIYEVIAVADVCAYSMEWIDGETLMTWIERRKHAMATAADAIRWCCRLGVAVAGALDSLHRHGLRHRDVKPSNVLLRADGTPLLSDFGLVHDAAFELTRTGQVLGTPAFAAPEQLLGAGGSLDATVDVYGLGATLHTALAGEVPFAGGTTEELLAAIRARRRVPLTEMGLPRDLETIVGRCLEYETRDRYASAAEVADELQRYLAVRPIHARPLGVLARAHRFARRNLLSLAIATAGAAAAFVVAGILMVMLVDALTFDRRLADAWQAARLQLLEPTHGERVILADRGEGAARSSTFRRAPMRAIAAFRLVAELAPDDPAAQCEFEVVRAASALLANEEPVGEALKQYAPATWSAALAWHRAPQRQIAVPADPDDRRLLGLLAFLTEHMQTCEQAWADRSFDNDPFVDAAIAQLLIARGRHDLAYPRAALARKEWPEVGFLQVQLADCAVQRGDLLTAARLLDRASTLPDQDPFESQLRVRADLDAANGNDAAAIAGYRDYLRRHRAPTARRNFAKLRERRREWGAACELWLGLYDSEPDGHRYLPEVLATWQENWLARNVAERIDAICQIWQPTSQTIDVRVTAIFRECTTAAATNTADGDVPKPTNNVLSELLMSIDPVSVHARRMPRSWRRTLAFLPAVCTAVPEAAPASKALRGFAAVALRASAGLLAAAYALPGVLHAQSCPALVNQLQMTTNGKEERFPRLSFSSSPGPAGAARGVLVWTHVASQATCLVQELAFASYGMSPLGGPLWSSAQPPTATNVRHSQFTLDHDPSGSGATLVYNSSLPVGQCADDLAWRSWNGGAFSPAMPIGDGVADNDATGCFRYDSSGSYGVLVWTDDTAAAGTNRNLELREYDPTSGAFGSNQVLVGNAGLLGFANDACLAQHLPSQTWAVAYSPDVGTAGEISYLTGQRSGGTWNWTGPFVVPATTGLHRGDQPQVSFGPSGLGVLAWTECTSYWETGPIYVAPWSSATNSFGQPVQLTTNSGDRLWSLVPDGNGWHVLFTRPGTGGYDQIHYGYWNGSALIGISELTRTLTDKRHVDAAADHTGTIHVTWLDGNLTNTEVWLARLDPTNCTAYGTGCAAAGGSAPVLTANGSPQTGSGTFSLDVTQGPPSSLAVAFLGSSQTSVTISGCQVLVAPTWLTLATVALDAGGAGSSPLPIPANPALIGTQLFGQYLVVEASGPFLGFATLSNGLGLQIR